MIQEFFSLLIIVIITSVQVQRFQVLTDGKCNYLKKDSDEFNIVSEQNIQTFCNESKISILVVVK